MSRVIAGFTPYVLLLCGLVGAFAQSRLSFDIVSIKPASPSAPRPGRLGTVQPVITPGRVTLRTATLKEIVQAAFGLEDYQVSGGPRWIDSTRYEVIAETASSTPQNQLLPMLQAVLAERFHLATHHEMKTVSGLGMVLAKGRKLRPLPAETNKGPLPTNRGRFTDLPSLAAYLTRLGSWPGQPGTPVVDKTGLTGQFDLMIDMNKIMANISEGTPATNEAIYAATVAHIEEALGLKLEPRKLQVDLLVIDHAEMPTAN